MFDTEKRLPPIIQLNTNKHHLNLHHSTKKGKISTFFPFEKQFSFLISSLSALSDLAPLQVDQLMCNKLFESLQVLSVELHIIVSSPLHPERLHWALTAFVQGQAVGEVDDLVLCTMNHQHWRCYLGNLVNAMKKKTKNKLQVEI